MDRNKGEFLLVIRLSAMGDVAMAIPVLLSLTRSHPALKLLVLTRPFFAPMFRDVPNSEVFPIDLKDRHKGLLGIYRLSRDLKSFPLTGIADLHNVLRTKALKLFLSGNSLPFVQQDKGRNEKKHLTRWKKKDLIPLKTTHERYADVFRKMGYRVELSSEDVLGKRPLGKELKEFDISGNQKLIGIAPFAAFQGKMYPLSLMEKALTKLNNTKKYKIIFFGGGAKEIKELNQLAKKYTNCFSCAGSLSFDQELDLISNLDLMVSMDSGNGHLAAMFGVPTVTLWGITHPFAGFAPFGQPPSHQILSDRNKYPLIPTSVYGNKFPDGYENVMESIDPEALVLKIETLTRK